MSEEKYETAYIEMTQEEKKKAGERITEVMEACRGIYESAEKGSADDVSLKEDVVHQMVEAAASEGRAVTCGNYDYNLQNYKDVDLALKEAGQGEKASAEYYKITASGTFQYYGLEAEGKELIVTYVSAVFQEDRLCEERTAYENLRPVLPRGTGKDAAAKILTELALPPDAHTVPVASLSGGMARRKGKKI